MSLLIFIKIGLLVFEILKKNFPKEGGGHFGFGDCYNGETTDATLVF